METAIRDAAATRGATVTVRDNGHVQIKGALLVNYLATVDQHPHDGTGAPVEESNS